MSIIVSLKDTWLVDVGYGDLLIDPIKVEDRNIIKDQFKFFRINKLNGTRYLLSESRNGIDFKKRYEFDQSPKQIHEFYDQCDFKQSSKNSHFVKNKICTVPNSKGRTTLLNNKLIKRVDGLRKEYKVNSETKFNEILKVEFGINLSNEKHSTE